MNASSRQKSVLSVLVVALMVLSTVVAVVTFAVPAAASPAGASGGATPVAIQAAPPPPAPPTQVVCTNPTTFGIGTVTTTYGYSGGNAPCSTANIFSAGSTVSFWLSTTPASTGIVGSSIGTAVLRAGSGNLDNVFTLTIPASTAAGTYYLLANSNAAPTSYQYGGAIVVATQPSFSISPTTASPEMQLGEMGSGWDPAATIDVTISYADAPYDMPAGTGFTAAPVQIDTFTTTAAGNFPASQLSNALPQLAAGSYVIVAQEVTAALPLSYMTADATLTIQGAVGTCHPAGYPSYETCSVGPVAPLGMVASIPGSTGSTFVLTGGGFTAGASISSITVGGVAATFTPATATVASDGAFTVTVTGLASKITAQGPATIVVTTSPASAPTSFPDAVVVSNPGISTSLMATDLVTSTSSGMGGDGLMYQGWGFAASGSGNVYFDGVARGESTDVNGYFLDKAASVPYLPDGAYQVFAEIGGYTASTTFTLGPFSGIFDSSGFGDLLTGEYAVSGSVIEVYAQGLAPLQQLDVTDTGLVSTFGTSSLDTVCVQFPATCPILSFSDGRFNAVTGTIQANSVGVIDVFYGLTYSQLATGASETTTLVTLPSGTTVTSATYLAVGPAVTSIATSYLPTGTVSLSISGLIPNGSAITPETAGYVGPFGIQIAGTPVAFSSPLSGAHYFFSTATGTASVTFTNPNAGPVETLAIYGDVKTSGALNPGSAQLYKNVDFITSTPSVSSGTVAANPAETSTTGGAGTSGSPWVFYADPAGAAYFIVFDLYDFPANTAVTVTVYTSAGVTTSTVTTDANGGGLYTFMPPDTAGVITPPGSPMYLLTFSATSVTISGNAYYWELQTAVSFDAAPFLPSGSPATDYLTEFGVDASVGGMVTVYVSNYLPNSPLDLVMTQSATAPLSGSGIVGTNLVAQATTNANGDATLTFAVPASLNGVTVAGLWYLYVVENTYNTGHGPFNINTAGLTIEFPDFNLYDGGVVSMPASTAFPGEIINFDWVPATLPASGVPVSVTIELNGTAYTTEPATFTGTDVLGTFTMPNDMVGSSWMVSLEWTQVTTSGGNTVVSTYPSTSVAPLALVSGAGALVVSVSVSQAQIVQIASLSGQFVNMTLTTLGAKITGIQNGVAYLNTSFGTMQASLAAIGATVTSISSGVAQLNTSLGSISATLKSLNATISKFNGTVVELASIVGTLSGTLSSINATVQANAVTTAQINANVKSLIGMVVYINTTSLAGISGQLGTISSGVTSVQGTVTAVAGNVATIQTGVGTLLVNASSIQGTLNQVKSNTSGTPNITTYLIIVIVLAIIAIVVGLLAVMRVNAVARRLEGRGSGGSQEPPK